MNLGHLIESVFQQSQTSPNLSRFHQQGAHLFENPGHFIGSGRMKGLGRTDFPHTDDHHFGETALDRPGKTGVELDPVKHQYPGALVTVTVHPDISGLHGSDLDTLHAGADFQPGGLRGQAQGFHHGLLTLCRGAVVGAHAGDEKGFRPVVA